MAVDKFSVQYSTIPCFMLVNLCCIYLYWDRALTTDLVFPALTIQPALFPLMIIPVLNSLSKFVSIGRLFTFFTNEELQLDSVQRLPK